jgi:low affinity Fe/Cu permease
MEKQGTFDRLATATADAAGHPVAFGVAAGTILVWGISGPLFGFSDTWQLIINTGTTIITFLMVFLIQSTQNADTKAIQIKLDELIRATTGAHNALLDLEELSRGDLARIRARYMELAERARDDLEDEAACKGDPEIDLGEEIADDLADKPPAEGSKAGRC